MSNNSIWVFRTKSGKTCLMFDKKEVGGEEKTVRVGFLSSDMVAKLVGREIEPSELVELDITSSESKKAPVAGKNVHAAIKEMGKKIVEAVEGGKKKV